MAIPLADQSAKLDRILNDRIGLYRLGHKKGTVDLEAASAKQAECEDIRRTFQWLVANAALFVEAFKANQQKNRIQAEFNDFIQSSDVALVLETVLEAFPGATLTRESHTIKRK